MPRRPPAKVARTATTAATSSASGPGGGAAANVNVVPAAATKSMTAPRASAPPVAGRRPLPPTSSQQQQRSTAQHSQPQPISSAPQGYHPQHPPPYSQITHPHHPGLPPSSSTSTMKPPPAVHRKRTTASTTSPNTNTNKNNISFKKKMETLLRPFPTLSSGPGSVPGPYAPTINYSIGGVGGGGGEYSNHSNHGYYNTASADATTPTRYNHNHHHHSHDHHAYEEHSQLSQLQPSISNSSSGVAPYTYEPPRQTNAIDEVINEVNHLLQAAAETQALGRLRNSYSSLLLAHQRLVGVGRRVDRSFCEAEHTTTIDSTVTDGEEGEASNLSMESTTTTNTPTFHPPLVSQPPLPPTLTQNYTDVAYVEHLAKSGMELHHKRTGRGMQHEAAIERAAHAQKMKRMEEEQIHLAARGVFALATGMTSEGGGGGKKRKGSDATDGGGEDGGTSPTKRKGGRGKKPPTLVMHTMAGRNLDVRELMRGVL